MTQQAPAIVLLHAFPLDRRIWNNQETALSGEFQVIVPDLRGFGTAYGQLAGLAEIPIDLIADDIAQLLDERRIKKAVIGGISRGGYAALAFARKYPERLQGLMLFDTRATPAEEKEIQTYSDLVKRLEVEGSSAAVDVMKTRLLGPETRAKNVALVQAIDEIILSQKPDAIIAGAIGMLNRPDARAGLSAIRVPTLAVAGVDDAAFASTRAIADASPEAEFAAVPHAGHLPILEQPDLVNATMRGFLARISLG
jgi:pimeloyl-ACP methyl ester carboxylesterase